MADSRDHLQLQSELKGDVERKKGKENYFNISNLLNLIAYLPDLLCWIVLCHLDIN